MSLAIGFAGSGQATPAAVKTLLDSQLLTEDVDIDNFWLPAGISSAQKGLAAVVGYLNKYWQGPGGVKGYEEGSSEEIMSALRGASEAVLVVLVGERQQPDDVTADMIEEAWQAGITVRDLSAGLDELTAGEDDADPAAGAAEVTADAPAARRRAKGTAVAAKPAPDGTAPPARRSTGRGRPRTEERSSDPGHDGQATDGPPWETSQSSTNGAQSSTNGARPAALDEDRLREIVRDELKQALTTMLTGAVTAVQGPLGQVRAYIRDDDGALRRRGPGKPRVGEEVFYYTDLEAQERGLAE